MKKSLIQYIIQIMTGVLTTTALVSVDISLRVRKMTQSTFFSQSRVCSMAYGSVMQVLAEHIGRALSTTNIQMMRTYY